MTRPDTEYRKDIVKMALEVGLPHWYQTEDVVNIERLEAFAKKVDAKATEREREKYAALLYLFQEWKEDHLSQSNYIEAVESIRAKGVEA